MNRPVIITSVIAPSEEYVTKISPVTRVDQMPFCLAVKYTAITPAFLIYVTFNDC